MHMRFESTTTGDAADRWLRGEQRVHWLGDTLDKQLVLEASKEPRFKENSLAWILYRRLTGKLVEDGAGMDQDTRIRLGTLISVFRIVGRPKMNPQEQEDMGIFFSRNPGFMLDQEELREAQREVLDDLELITNTFDIRLNLEP